MLYQPQPLLLVAFGGAVGASLRYYIAGILHRMGPEHFSIGILSVNVLGSLMMGVLIETLAHYLPGNQNLRIFLSTGLLGGFTTFSAFSLESVVLLERGHYGYAAIYILGTVALSILALFLGMFVMRSIFS